MGTTGIEYSSGHEPHQAYFSGNMVYYAYAAYAAVLAGEDTNRAAIVDSFVWPSAYA